MGQVVADIKELPPPLSDQMATHHGIVEGTLAHVCSYTGNPYVLCSYCVATGDELVTSGFQPGIFITPENTENYMSYIRQRVAIQAVCMSSPCVLINCP